jgi:hypothetical protein
VFAVCFGLVAFSVTSRPAEHVLQREAEELAAWIRMGTALAAERGQELLLTYDLGVGEMAVRQAVSTDAGSAPITLHSVRKPVLVTRLVLMRGEPEVIEAGRVEVAVSAEGTCEPHLVTLTRPGIGSWTLEVNPITGEVEVLEGLRDYERLDLDKAPFTGTGARGPDAG